MGKSPEKTKISGISSLFDNSVVNFKRDVSSFVSKGPVEEAVKTAKANEGVQTRIRDDVRYQLECQKKTYGDLAQACDKNDINKQNATRVYIENLNKWDEKKEELTHRTVKGTAESLAWSALGAIPGVGKYIAAGKTAYDAGDIYIKRKSYTRSKEELENVTQSGEILHKDLDISRAELEKLTLQEKGNTNLVNGIVTNRSTLEAQLKSITEREAKEARDKIFKS